MKIDYAVGIMVQADEGFEDQHYLSLFVALSNEF